MSKTPSAPESSSKPHWQTQAAAGAMAAGLVVGKKSALGLALGVAALAGARWLNRKKQKSQTGVAPLVAVQPAPGPVAEEKHVVPVAPSSAVAERIPSVMVYQQPAEMPSCSATADGMVWFALFNDGPQGMGRIAPPAGTPGLGLAKITLPEKAGGGEVFNGGPLPESFFSEAPDEAENADEEKADLVEELPTDAVDASVVSAESKLEPSVPTEAAEHPIAPHSPSFVLPKKREAGESPRAWAVPAAWSQFTVRPKVDASGSSVHRSILPHEAMDKNRSSVHWPLVTAATVIVLAVAALVIFGAGLVSEWNQHWSHSQATATADEGDIGLWSKDVAKVAASPATGR